MYLLQGLFTHWLLLDYTSTLLERTKNETRLTIWRMFGAAALQQPWLGYGWNQSVLAQLAATAVQYTEKGSNTQIFSSAHNLFIDLLLWLGIPLGLITSAAIVTWLGRAASHVKNSLDALLVLGVVSMGVHAMLEFPLYYTYFLLPLGLMVGMLDLRLQHRHALVTGLRPLILVWLTCCFLFVVVVRDYFVIEESYSELRQDAARIASKTARQPPDVLILTQLRDYIALARLEPALNMGQDKIDWVTNVTQVYPAEHNLLKLATILALNGRAWQASEWLAKLCNLYPDTECIRARTEWDRLQVKFPQLSKVAWPTVPATANPNHP